MKSWLKEISRDLLALGSIIFYFLVVIRAIIGKYNIFVYQMLIAISIIFILNFIIKGSNLHIARAFVALVFTSTFYKEELFTIFAGAVWILMLLSAFYVKRKMSPIFRAIVISAISTVIAYYLAPLI